MHKYKEHIDESRRRSSKNKRSKNFNDQWQEKDQYINHRFVLPSNKMKLVVSDRLKYILTKMSETGNIISNDFLKLLEQKLESYEMSYIDITPKEDTFSYLPSSGKNLPDSDKFKNNKRQHSKIYKIIKTIFGNRFTKNEVQKFVSIYKSIYNKGPQKENLSPMTIDQMVEKLITDTKNDKLKWDKISNASNWIKYESRHKITNNKYLVFVYYIFNNIKDKKLTFLTANIYNDLGQNKEDKNKFIRNFRYEEIKDLTEEIIKKYNIEIK